MNLELSTIIVVGAIALLALAGFLILAVQVLNRLDESIRTSSRSLELLAEQGGQILAALDGARATLGRIESNVPKELQWIAREIDAARDSHHEESKEFRRLFADRADHLIAILDRETPKMQPIPAPTSFSASSAPQNDDQPVTWSQIRALAKQKREEEARKRAQQEAQVVPTPQTPPAPPPSEPWRPEDMPTWPQRDEEPVEEPPAEPEVEPEGTKRFTSMDEIFRRAQERASVHGEG